MSRFQQTIVVKQHWQIELLTNDCNQNICCSTGSQTAVNNVCVTSGIPHQSSFTPSDGFPNSHKPHGTMSEWTVVISRHMAKEKDRIVINWEGITYSGT